MSETGAGEATALGHDHTGPDWECEACKPLADVLRSRMRWGSLHWGTLHDDAYPSLARAVYESDLLAADRARVRAETLAEVERQVVEAAPSIGFGVDSITGAEDREASAYVEGFHDAWQAVRGMAEAGER